MASIDFIPKRINDPPVVFRGMTLREVMLMAGAGFGICLVPGIVLAVIAGMPALAPTVAFLGMAGALGVGGTLMRRLRRGRPPSLLYRQIAWALATRGISLGAERLITRSSVYRLGRERRGQGGIR